MELIDTVDFISAHLLAPPLQASQIVIWAKGTVSTSGWTDIRIIPRWDKGSTNSLVGIVEFELVGDPPLDPVFKPNNPFEVTALRTFPLEPAGGPINQVRVTAANGMLQAVPSAPVPAIATPFLPHPRPPRIPIGVLTAVLARYDDSFQPTGNPEGFHIPMKKLSHTLTLTAESNAIGVVESCFEEAVAAGLVVAIVTAAATEVAVIPAALETFKDAFALCISNHPIQVDFRIDDNSVWVYWTT